MSRSRADGTNPRAMGTNLRALGVNPKALRRVKRAAKKMAWAPTERAKDEPLPKWLRFEIMKRDKFRCVYCGAAGKDGVLLQIDHIKPRALGGTDELSNLTTACQPCNSGKGARPLHRSAM